MRQHTSIGSVHHEELAGVIANLFSVSLRCSVLFTAPDPSRTAYPARFQPDHSYPWCVWGLL